MSREKDYNEEFEISADIVDRAKWFAFGFMAGLGSILYVILYVH